MPTGVLVDSLCQETMNMGWYGKEQIRIQKHVELKSMHYITFNCLLVLINHYESLLIIIGHLISLLSHYLLYKSQLWNQILHDIPIWLMSHEKYLCPRPSCWLVELPITDWWKWCCHWRQWQRTMQHPTFGRGIDLHPGCCRHCGCHRSDGTVVATRRNRRGQCEIPLGWRNCIHADCSRAFPYSASPEWWQCGCCRTAEKRCMQNSRRHSSVQRFDIALSVRICSHGNSPAQIWL